MNAHLSRKLLVVSMIKNEANETEKIFTAGGIFSVLIAHIRKAKRPQSKRYIVWKMLYFSCVAFYLKTLGHLEGRDWPTSCCIKRLALLESLYLQDVCELLYATTSRHAFNYGANDIHVISSRPPSPHFGGIILNSKTQKESFFSCNLPGGISPRSSMAFLSIILFFGFLKWSTTIY